MSEKYYVGKDVTSFSDKGKYKPISRVTLLVDDENSLTAGDYTGMEVIASCPHATQPMVNALLQTMKGYQYQAYEAGAANIDPAAELGDGVTVGGIYSPLSKLSDDGRGYADISSPGEAEMEDEYPSEGYIAQEFNRKIAETRSAITKTSEEIKLEVQGVDGRVSKLQLTLDGVTITGSDGVTRIKGGMIQANSVTATQIDATNLKVAAANITGTLTIGQLPSSVAETGDIPTKVSQLWNDNGYQTETGVTTIINGTVTTDYVNALGITAQYVSANAVLADGITLNGMFHVPGYGYIGGRNSIANAAAVMSGENMRGYCLAGSVSAAIVYDNYKIWVQYDGAFTNDSDGISVYSDRRMKHDIRYDIDRYDAFFDALKPASFLFNGDKYGRRKTGMIAQDVLAAMELAGIEQSDFSALKYSKEEDRYFLAYEPFISLCIEQIQRLKKRLNVLETKLEGIA